MQPRRAPLALLVCLAVTLLVPPGCSKKDSPTSPKIGPTANFIAAPVSGNSPMDVDFTNQSESGSSQITSMLWDFGDGSTSSATNPFHTYSQAGTYTVSLTVASADGANTRIRDDYIVVASGTGALPPNAAFTANTTSGPAPLNVTFTDQSTPGTSPITSWQWTFGDGGTSTAQNPSHTYSSNGSYTVSLHVMTSDNLSDTASKGGYVVVQPTPVAPTAAFIGVPTDGVQPLTVQFTDQSVAGSQPITLRAWTFGDGGVSAATNPSHTYGTAGTYTVSLTVTTLAGSDGETKTGYITVRPTPVPPTAQFSGTPTTGAAPLTVNFTDQSTAGTSTITDWAWTFGDGGVSTLQNPSHVYNAAGNYNVTLQVTSADGQNTMTKTGYIKPCATPVADFTGTPASGTAPLTVAFHDASTGGPNAFSWNFGDGSTSTSKDVNHVYNTPGTYTVTHTAGNACGTDTVTKASFITAQDPCPNPIYSVTSTTWTNITAGTDPGYRARARLTWNTQVSVGCSRSVFARVFTRPMGDSTWTFYGASACYTVSGSKTSNPFSMFLQHLPKNCYQIRVAVYECGSTDEKASRGPADDPNLTNQCFEP